MEAKVVVPHVTARLQLVNAKIGIAIDGKHDRIEVRVCIT